MDTHAKMRRQLLCSAAATGGLVLAPVAFSAESQSGTPPTEDLMREHGVLRRALDVYRHCAEQLRAGHDKGIAKALNQTARLFRDFGEDYHERAIEEAYVFPMLLKQPGPIAGYPSVLTAQHHKGREVTDYILGQTKSGSVSRDSAGKLADTLDAFTWMYSNHAAREDTVAFIAWKKLLSDQQRSELQHTFETIEQRHVGEDGFEHMVKKIADIESELGLGDLSQFTLHRVPV